jgi:hypothetical protein
VKIIQQIRRAWRLYQTDSQFDTALAVVLVLLVLSPFVYTWWQMRSSGGEQRANWR